MSRVRPTMLRVTPYAVPRLTTPVDLHLDSNEGATPLNIPVLDELLHDPQQLRRYPSAQSLEGLIATQYGFAPDSVMVTAGADEAIDRLCRVILEPGVSIVLPWPSFEMLRQYAQLSGAEIRTVPWLADTYPLDDVLNAVDASTAMIAVVTPNNPTGAIATRTQIQRLAEAMPEVVVLVDLAYIEFADDDPTELVSSYPNIVVTRSLSKSWGLAGLRVGFAIGDPLIIKPMRSAGGPYSVSSLSLAIARHCLESQGAAVTKYTLQTRKTRKALIDTLQSCGAVPQASQANFVLARFSNASWVREALAGLGVAVRAFPDTSELSDALRITCPDAGDFARLAAALVTVLRPEALLLDMDGVLIDVSRSYHQAIIGTAKSYGVTIDDSVIHQIKNSPDTNNDWIVTYNLLMARGVVASQDEVKEHFEWLYQGDDSRPGLWEQEQLLCEPNVLSQWRERIPLAIVTGRPHRDAMRTLEQFKLQSLFDAVICMEDAPVKPSPEPVLRALNALGAQRAWMVGDTPDDIRAARSANVVPIGVLAPGCEPDDTRRVLMEAGAGRVASSLVEIGELLP